MHSSGKMRKGLKFGVWGYARIEGLGSRLLGLGVWGLGFRAQGSR